MQFALYSTYFPMMALGRYLKAVKLAEGPEVKEAQEAVVEADTASETDDDS